MLANFWGALRRCVLIGVLLLAVPLASQAAGQPLLVFAAASLKNAMDGVVSAYRRDHSADVRVSYAGSSTLARQIERGAPADVYVSADQQWMDRLQHDKRIDASSRVNLLGNSLVLIAPKQSKIQLRIKPHFNLVGKLGRGNYLAMANTDAVPAGIYGRNALSYLGVWKQVKSHVAQADDVRAALHLVDMGESPLGIVYASDAVADRKRVRVVDTFPDKSHAPIIYPAAIIAGHDSPQSEAFLRFMHSDQAAGIFRKWGFRVLAN